MKVDKKSPLDSFKSKLKSIKPINQEIEIISEEKSAKKRLPGAVLRQKTVHLLRKLQYFRISLHDFHSQALFPKEPFSRGKPSKELISLARNGDMTKINKLVTGDQFLVYDFDNNGETALSIACKRNNTELVTFLLANRADANHQNFVNQNCMFFAVRNNNPEIVKKLLLHRAETEMTPSKPFMQGEIHPRIELMFERVKKLKRQIKLFSTNEKYTMYDPLVSEYLSPL